MPKIITLESSKKFTQVIDNLTPTNAKKARTISTCRNFALRILTIKDYSEKEMREKLEAHDYEAEEIERTMQELINRNWLNDQRLAENLLTYYLPNRGLTWIRVKMQQRKISPEIISQTLIKGKKEDNSSNLLQLKKKLEAKYKVSSWSKLDTAQIRKILIYLGRNGYPQPMQIINSFKNDNN